MTHVAIVGGGISGLSAAYYLTRSGCECTLVEADPRLGGVIRTEQVDGCIVEAGPDSFISQKPWALELIRELGLEQDVIGSNDRQRKTYIVKYGRLVPMPDGLYLMVPTAVSPLLRTPLLGFRTKLKMALELLRRPSGRWPDRPVAALIRYHYGQEAVDYLAEPLLAGIYGGNAAELSAASVLPRFVEFERKYGSITRGVLAGRSQARGGAKPPALFLTLKGGMQQLINAIEGAVRNECRVIRGRVASIERLGARYRLHFDGQSLEADQVIVATPAWSAGELLRNLDAPLANLLFEIRYHSSITAALGYDRSEFGPLPNGFGFLVPRVERGLLSAGTWVGTKFPYRVPENRVLLRAFIGAGNDEGLLARSDDSLLASVRDELAELLLLKIQPAFWRINRWPRAMAQYLVGHEGRMEEIRARLARWPGLHLAGNAYLGIGVPDCIHTAQLAARRIIGAQPEIPPLTPEQAVVRS